MTCPREFNPYSEDQQSAQAYGMAYWLQGEETTDEESDDANLIDLTVEWYLRRLAQQKPPVQPSGGN